MTARWTSGGARRLFRIAAASIAAPAACAALAAPAATASPPGVPVFTEGQNGYSTIRIPSLERTNDGTLLAFAEARVNSQADDGDIDIVLRRSEDGGRNWGPLQKVWDVGTDRVGNPTPVVDRRTGIVHLIVIRTGGEETERSIRLGTPKPQDARRVFHLSSSDDGATWSKPREITHTVKPRTFRHYATRPGHGIQLQRGAHAGRLLISANHSVAPPAGSGDTGLENKYYACHVIYSDNGGLTWELGAVDTAHDGYVNCNEQTAEELVDGRIAFNARDQHGTAPGSRAVSTSDDGGDTFAGPFLPEPQLRAPVVQGSLLRFSATDRGGGENRILFSAPGDPTARRAMTIWSSTDETQTWDAGTLIYEGPSAYSDQVKIDAETSGLLFEAGVSGPYESITFVRFTP